MEQKSLSKNAALLLRLRCTLIAAAVAFVLGGVCVFSMETGLILGALAALCYLFFLFFYTPRFVKSAWYALSEEQLTVSRGVFIKKRTALHLHHVQYMRLKAGPIQRFYRCASLTFEVAGARVTLSDLDDEDAQRLKRLSQKEDVHAL